MKTFETTMSFKFRQTDMIGIGYFNEVFNLFHDSYEDWAELVCGSKSEWFGNPDWAVPIKKIESEYMRPLMAFETYKVQIETTQVGSSSFTLKCQILKGDQPCCVIQSTHVFMSKKTFKSVPIPEKIAEKLKS